MKFPIHFAASMFVFACATKAIAQDAAPPKLPDQYAEVVLRVEGMI